MSYLKWFDAHAKKHEVVLAKLYAQYKTKEEIIAYFRFENMQKNEPDFCVLYAKNQKCHDLDYLNCFLCACPHFRFNDEGLKLEEGLLIKSQCAIKSRKSSYFEFEKVAHLDCSRCSVPHTKAFVEKHFDMSWKRIMQKCLLTSQEGLS